MLWGGTPYVVNHIPRQGNKVEKVKNSLVELKDPSPAYPQINLLTPIKVTPYQVKFMPIPVSVDPGTDLIVHPQPRVSHNSHPCLVQVNSEKCICLPLTNATKKEKTSRKGTILGSYKKVEGPPCTKVNITYEIHNDPLPQNDHVKQGTRAQRLQELIESQDWKHFTGS